MKSVSTIILCMFGLVYTSNAQTDFSVSKKDNTTVLKWTSAAERNNQPFFIERSSNGITYQRVGSVTQANGVNDVQFIDAQPDNGVNYYRVQQVDGNGRTYYSSIRKIDLNARPLEVKVLPNPIQDRANLTINSSSSSQVKVLMQVIDNNGRIVWQENQYLSQGINNINITANTWSKGLYYLNIVGSENGAVKTSLVKL